MIPNPRRTLSAAAQAPTAGSDAAAYMGVKQMSINFNLNLTNSLFSVLFYRSFLWFILCQSHNFLPCRREQVITYHCKHSKAEGNRETQHYPCSIKIFADNICTWNSDCPKHQNINNGRITHPSRSIYNRYYTIKNGIEPLGKQHDNNMSARIHQHHFI